MSMHAHHILVLGAGKIGTTLADMLTELYEMPVTLADVQPAPPHSDPLLRHLQLDVQDDAALTAALAAHSLVINALPFFCAARVATAATQRGVHYFDLTEDVAATRTIRALAPRARAVLMPQCGLAPGLIGMLGGHLARQFDELYDLQLRVGALTLHALNALRYHFTWSVDGVINEYCNPCDAIVGGQLANVQPLEGLEKLSLDGQVFEAFNTSGGLGTLCETLAGRVRNLNYKTIRHPGHRDAMHLLLHGLRLLERRDLLRQVLDGAVPHSKDDMVVVASRHGPAQRSAGTAHAQRPALRCTAARAAAHGHRTDHGRWRVGGGGTVGPGPAAATRLCATGAMHAFRLAQHPCGALR